MFAFGQLSSILALGLSFLHHLQAISWSAILADWLNVEDMPQGGMADAINLVDQEGLTYQTLKDALEGFIAGFLSMGIAFDRRTMPWHGWLWPQHFFVHRFILMPFVNLGISVQQDYQPANCVEGGCWRLVKVVRHLASLSFCWRCLWATLPCCWVLERLLRCSCRKLCCLLRVLLCPCLFRKGLVKRHMAISTARFRIYLCTEWQVYYGGWYFRRCLVKVIGNTTRDALLVDGMDQLIGTYLCEVQFYRRGNKPPGLRRIDPRVVAVAGMLDTDNPTPLPEPYLVHEKVWDHQG